MRSTKLDKLVAAYTRFGAGIAEVPDDWAQRLYRTASGLSEKVASLRTSGSGVTPSQLASGLEQGLRETPDIIACVGAEWRPLVSGAFRSAISAEYPEFYAKDQKKLERVVARGKIGSEAEFYLLRHHAETLEGDPEQEERLAATYALLEAYELRA
jgi:hypothetical protein